MRDLLSDSGGRLEPLGKRRDRRRLAGSPGGREPKPAYPIGKLRARLKGGMSISHSATIPTKTPVLQAISPSLGETLTKINEFRCAANRVFRPDRVRP